MSDQQGQNKDYSAGMTDEQFAEAVEHVKAERELLDGSDADDEPWAQDLLATLENCLTHLAAATIAWEQAGVLMRDSNFKVARLESLQRIFALQEQVAQQVEEWHTQMAKTTALARPAPTEPKPPKPIKRYHVFGSDCTQSDLPCDAWFDTRKEAEAAYRRLTYANKRLYIEVYEDEWDLENDLMLEENCLRSRGEFPI